MEVPHFFRCPISMELMQDPVTLSTGVTYERKNIEKWLFAYKKTMCPATMQSAVDSHLTPNHTLKRLIISWQLQARPSSSIKASQRDQLTSILNKIESTPFKVGSLKKLRSLIVEMGDNIESHFAKSGGIEVMGRIIFQILGDNNADFAVFRACEEALGVLYHLPLSEEASIRFISKPECLKSMSIMLQRGSTEARFHAVTILQKMVKIDCNLNYVLADQDIAIVKSLLELLSDEICTNTSSSALEVLIEISISSRKNRLKAIESGAICILIELLPDSNRSKCEKMLYLLKLLCEFAEGRSVFADHDMAIPVVSKKLGVSELATKLGVKILCMISSFNPTKKIMEEMLVFGSINKMMGWLQVNGSCSMKEKTIKIIKLYGTSWRNHPCFPGELEDYLRLMH